MATPSVALAALARVNKAAPAQRLAAQRLGAEVKIALSEARRADSKSALSFWGRVVELSSRIAALRKSVEPVFDDAEHLRRHRRELPGAAPALDDVRRLCDALDELVDSMGELQRHAARISDKSGQLAKIKLEVRNPKLESTFQKSFDAGISALSALTVVLLVLKKLAGTKSSLK